MQGENAIYKMLVAQAQNKQGREQTENDTSIVRLVDFLLMRAINLGASDLHIEPYEGKIRLRHRIDGLLAVDKEFLPQILALPLTSRIKVLAGLDIAQKQRPQDGHIRYKAQNKIIDIRVAVMPVADGEMLVLRFLNTAAELLDMSALGFSQSNKALFEKLIHRPAGMIIVCGPMNSGKTTTLYAALAELNNDSTNIVTLEDPVERKIAGINQIQLNPKAGLTYNSGLKAILRQDCDRIFLGEIRDAETAEMAVRIALTGHLVLTTLHTENAAAAVYRLLEMGIPAYMLAATLTAVVAQRLVRRICPECLEEYEALPQDKAFLTDSLASQKLYRGAGCGKCHGTGFLGRMAIHEVLEINDVLRDAITKQASLEEFSRLAREGGLISMWQDGITKALNGKTTLDEVRRVLYGS